MDNEQLKRQILATRKERKGQLREAANANLKRFKMKVAQDILSAKGMRDYKEGGIKAIKSEFEFLKINGRKKVSSVSL